MVSKFIGNYVLNLKSIIFLFFIILILRTTYYLYFIDLNYDGFILGDWLVNYHDGGFKRRGLSGSLFFLLQDITGIKLISLVYMAQMTLTFTFLLLICKIVLKKQITLLYFTLIISPLTFLVYFNQNLYFGRKEIILFNIFALYLYLINENKLTIFKEYLIFILLFIATLFHEITIFYIPYFILAHFIIYKKPDLKKYILFFLSCFLPALLIFLFGAKTNEGASLSIIASRGIILQDFSIFSFSNGLFQDLHLYKANPLGYSLYVLSLVLGIFHFGYYIKKETDLNYKRVIPYFILTILYSIPIFILACDWGRWLQIHFVLLFLILTFNLPNIGNEGVWEKSKLVFNRKNIIYLIFVPFLIFWQVRINDLGFWFTGLTTILRILNNIFNSF